LFGAADTAAAGYLEIYGVPEGAVVTGKIELVQSAQGPAIVERPATVEAANAPDMRIAYGEFSIATLPPGDYLVRMVLTVDGKVAVTATRALRKTG
jgi:hypothetical protein